jgi:hypothetical protein
MHKNQSRRLQQRNRSSAALRSQKTSTPGPIDEANQEKTPHYVSVLRNTRGAGIAARYPKWLVTDIAACGGADGWIKKNAYWQKRIRLDHVGAVELSLRSNAPFVGQSG